MPLRLSVAALCCGVLAILPVTAGAALPADGTLLVGAAAPGVFTALETPVQQSELGRGSVSDDGRYVAFASDADGLSGEDDDRIRSVYVKDRLTGAVELVSRATGAAGAVNHDLCSEPSISDNGQRVAFSCSGPLDPSDTNDTTDVYVRDRAAQVTTLVSRSLSEVGDSSSQDPQISGNGAYVVFTSHAGNLILSPPSGTHVYRRQLGSSTIALVDQSQVALSANGSARFATISDDGTRVAFTSDASNLAVGVTDANNVPDVYLRNVNAGTTTLVSATSASTTTAGNGAGSEPAISGNGAYVAYVSNASNAATGDGDGSANIHRRTLASGQIDLIDRASGDSGAKASGYQYGVSIDDSGDRVAFVSNATNLSGAANGRRQFYVRLMASSPKATVLASRQSGAGGAVAASDVGRGVLSGDGAIVALPAIGLAPDADPFVTAVFARELSGPQLTTLVSRPAGTDPFVNRGADATLDGPGAMGADGRFTVFSSSAAGLPGQPGTGKVQAWRRDNLTGEVVLVSRADGPNGAPLSGDVSNVTISADGNRVAFYTDGSGPESSGAYVRDVAAGTTTIASRADGAQGALVAYPWRPALSANGRRVAFVSDSAVLGVADGRRHVFVRDLEAGTTTAVGATQQADADLPRLSADGGRVVWEAETDSGGSPGGGGSSESHVWVADVTAGSTPSQLDAGAPADQNGSAPTISDDGTRAAFASGASLVAADVNDDTDVYVRDLASGTLTVASLTAGGAPGDAGAYVSQISGDGQRVAFISDATNLVPDATTSVSRAYVRDLGAGTTTLASRADGAAGAPLGGVNALSVSVDGRCVAFQTSDTTVVAGLSPFVSRVWLRAVGGTCPATPPGTGGPGPGPGPGGGRPAATPKPPVVSGFKAAPATFRTTGRKPGTTLRFRLSRAAHVKIVLARVSTGHRVGKRCRAGAPKRRQRACRLLRTVTTITRTGRTGANSVRFTGKVKGRRLPRGSYVATLTATASKRTSKPVTVKLRVR